MKGIIISMLISLLICGLVVLVFVKLTEKRAAEMGIKSTYDQGIE